MELTKSERRQLRQLAGEVYEAEAHRVLEKLDQDFERWRRNEMLSSELLGTIHDFHQHRSRELWSMYNGATDSMVVSRGVGLGLLPESKVPPAILVELDPDFWREGNH